MKVYFRYIWDSKCVTRVRTLMWKSFVIRRRSFPTSLLEILMPLVLSVAMALARGLQEGGQMYKVPSAAENFSASSFVVPRTTYNATLLVAFEDLSPTFQNDLLQSTDSEKCDLQLVRVESGQLVNRLYDFMYGKSDTDDRLIGGAIFKNNSGTVEITLRMINQLVKRQIAAPVTGKMAFKESEYGFGYYGSDFLTAQQCLMFKRFRWNRTDEKDVRLEELLMLDRPDHILALLLPIAIALGWLVGCVGVARRICEEKQSKTKEMFHLMGTNLFTFWFHHFATNIVVMVFQSLLVTSILIVKVSDKSAVYNANFFLVLLILLLYSASGILFCMSLTTVWTKPWRAAGWTAISWCLSISIPKIVVDHHVLTPGYTSYPAVYYLLMLLPNTALEFAFMHLYQIPEASFRNLRDQDDLTQLTGMTLLTVLLLMFASCFFYAALICIFDTHWSTVYGIRHVLYKLSRHKYVDSRMVNKNGITVQNVTKKYKSALSSYTKVDSVSFEALPGEITVIFGCEGSGKSALLDILMGLSKPTTGAAFLCGHNVVLERYKAANQISACQQENVFYNELTVLENLQLFASIKGVHPVESSINCAFVVNLLQMKDKKKVEAKNLSYRNQRKLAVALALVCRSKIMIFDEPTSGMDAKSARLVWELLRKISSDHVIVVGTNNVEEVLTLGDRIIALNNGRIKAKTTVKQLALDYSIGYNIKFTKTKTWNSKSFENIAQKHLGKTSIKLVSQTPEHFVVCVDYKQANTIQKFLLDVMNEAGQIGANIADMRLVSAEEVLLQLCFGAQKTSNTKLQCSKQTAYNPLKSAPFFKTFVAILWLQLLFARRSVVILLVLLNSVLVAFLLLALIEIKISQGIMTANDEVVTSDITRWDHVLLFDQGGHQMSSAYNQTIKNQGLEARTVVSEEQYRNQFVNGSQWLFGANLKFANSCIAGNHIALYNRLRTYSTFFSLNAIHNAYDICRDPTKENNTLAKIQSRPLPNNVLKYIYINGPIRLIYIIFLGFCLALLMYPIHLFHSYIRLSKNKYMIRMSGLRRLSAWCAHLVYDIFYLAIAVTTVFGVMFFTKPNLTRNYPKILASLALLIFLFGLAFIPCIYLVSAVSRKFEKNNIIILEIFLLCGTIPALILSSIDIQFTESDTVIQPYGLVFNIVIALCETSPVFNIIWSIQKLNHFAYLLQMCETMSSSWKRSLCANRNQSTVPSRMVEIFSWKEVLRCCPENCAAHECFVNRIYSPFTFGYSGILQEVVMMLIDCVTFWILFVLIEKELGKFFADNLVHERTEGPVATYKKEDIFSETPDEAVVKEAKDVVDSWTNRKHNYCVVVKNLTKKGETSTIVNDLSFRVERGTTFGIFGVFGSGSSTLLRMMATEIKPTSGSVMVNGYEMTEKSYRHQIGYSPKTPILFSKLTVKETIVFYGTIRGLRSMDRKTETSDLLKVLRLEECQHKTGETLTNVQQIKLAMAIAFIGSPPLILIDSPFAAVDERERMILLEGVEKLKSQRKNTVILATSIFEVCQALCNKVAVMSFGQFRYIGSCGIIRQKFAKGYFVIIKLVKVFSADRMNEPVTHSLEQTKFRNIMNEKFSKSAFLINQYQHFLQFHITAQISKQEVFAGMEVIKETCRLDEYLVTDASFEQFIFGVILAQTLSQCTV